MCTIKNRIHNKKEFTGYKVVVTDKYGHHYSPYTGIRYKPGPVLALPKKMGKYCANDLGYYNAYMPGKCMSNDIQAKLHLTAVFVDLKNAIELIKDDFLPNRHYKLPNNCKYNIIKMTVSGDLYNGLFSGDIILGNVINSVGPIIKI
jgi:hypothetical protein